MKPIRPTLALLVMLMSTSCAHAATLRVRGTIPLDNNDAPCGLTPILSPASDSAWCVFRVPSASIADSVKAPRGTTVTKSWQVPAGIYDITAYAARVVNNVWLPGCPTTIQLEAPAHPHRVTLSP